MEIRYYLKTHIYNVKNNIVQLSFQPNHYVIKPIKLNLFLFS